MPHAHCVLYDRTLILVSMCGNILTSIAYFAIPFLLGKGTLILWNLLHRTERGLFIHAAAFIALCGTTHVLATWNWYHSNYWVEACVGIATGIVSITFAFRLRRFLQRRFYRPV